VLREWWTCVTLDISGMVKGAGCELRSKLNPSKQPNQFERFY
jgi:tartrate dehydratase alpha subunit/fumarate hydratase class I-like protein